MRRACKACEQGECENDVNACRDPSLCACCGEQSDTGDLGEQDQEELWDLLDSSS